MERRLQSIGKSLLISLPKPWIKQHRLSKGDTLHFYTDANGALNISPTARREKKETDITIPLDKDFRRQFYRAYFAGYIHINLTGGGEYREKLHDFLELFMNVQVLEENVKKIKLLCYDISELSIEECLDKMYHVAATMIQETSGHANMEKTLTKFYYLLILQVRRFIDSGKYAQHNQITLLRALDCRMVAEKIENIADIAKTHKLPGSDRKVLYPYLMKAFDAFKQQNFKKAAGLWEEERRLKLKSEPAKEIATLIRQTSGFVR